MCLHVYWWFVLFQPGRAWQLARRLCLQEDVRDRMCAPTEISKTAICNWQLLGIMPGGVDTFTRGQPKASETADLRKLQGLGRVRLRKRARKVSVSSPSSAARCHRYRRRISRFLACSNNSNAKPLKLVRVVLRHFLPQGPPCPREQFWRLHGRRRPRNQFWRGNAQNPDA